ncbi:organic cation/carnitine transporter 2-like isoform X2 [Ruditapes philippinarum]|uniref:organic cation/carnitine transporter 2-like isoform X2 n=1 Tax=Ruditapes philippinarum TaxID=129788 RepID=UPI00295A818F|nr:organic cation/carnitine transporter 2-like isoform X2 [Ruditapes philippinarum]
MVLNAAVLYSKEVLELWLPSILPESFRWYIARDRIEDASKVIARVAMINKHPLPDISNLDMNKNSTKKENNYTFIHLFKSKELSKATVLLSINWFALGLVFYGISFGIQALAGNIYLNLFLFSVVSIPAKIITVYLTNRFGRRIAAMICFLGVAVGGLVAGIAQAVDTPHRDLLTNVFAIIASMTINMAWGPVQTMTIEVYPTVIRNIGFGSLSVIARFGAILGPQFVYLNMYVPGLLFFVCGGIAILCLVSQQFLPETRDSNLNDKIHQKEVDVMPLGEKDTNIK